jgi:hypothetical protein
MLNVTECARPLPSSQSNGNGNGDSGGRRPGACALGGDRLLYGAAEIAEFIFGDEDRARTIYHWFEHGLIPPAFKVGKTICASKFELRHWMRGNDGPAVRVKADTVLWQH